MVNRNVQFSCLMPQEREKSQFSACLCVFWHHGVSYSLPLSLFSLLVFPFPLWGLWNIGAMWGCSTEPQFKHSTLWARMEERETGRCEPTLLSTSFQNGNLAFQTAPLGQLHLGLKSFTMKKPLLQKAKNLTLPLSYLPQAMRRVYFYWPIPLCVKAAISFCSCRTAPYQSWQSQLSASITDTKQAQGSYKLSRAPSLHQQLQWVCSRAENSST